MDNGSWGSPNNYYASLVTSNSYYYNNNNNNNKTLLYRQKILQLAATTSATQIGWLVSQHILDRLWSSQQQRQYAEDTKKSSRTKNPNNNNNNINDSHPTGSVVQRASSSSFSSSFGDTILTNKILYACQQCGSVIHPGWRGSHLRVKTWRRKTGKSTHLSSTTTTVATTTTASRKTIRRRDQRARGRRKHLPSSSSSPNVAYDNNYMRKRSNNNSPSSTTITPSYQSNVDGCSSGKDITTPPLILLLMDDNDGEGRKLKNSIPKPTTTSHSLMVTCGRCHDKVVLNGVKKRQAPPLQPQQERFSLTSTPNRNGQGGWFKKQMSNLPTGNSRTTTTTTATLLDVEYLALPPTNENKRKRSLLVESGISSNSNTLANDALMTGQSVGSSILRRTPKMIKLRKGSQQQQQQQQRKSKLADFLSSLNDP
jgi:hypothetical protein